MIVDDLVPIVEAILFSSGTPLTIRQISKTLDISDSETEITINNLVQRLQKNNSGILILKIDDKYQMCSNPKYAKYVRATLNIQQPTLSSSAMEVLSIVAYNEPVTKNFIQSIRGVDSSGIINKLVEKNLIQESGRLDIPGKPIVYSTTDNFLRCFNLTSLKELPEISNVRN